MKRNELEKIYQRQGCRDYHLRDAQDLLTVHRVDFTTVKGYTELTDENKVLYCAFIVNYWNAYGLDTRMTMISKGIYFVEDQEFDYHYTNPYDGREMAATAKREIKVILASGKKRTLHKYVDKDGETPEQVAEAEGVGVSEAEQIQQDHAEEIAEERKMLRKAGYLK